MLLLAEIVNRTSVTAGQVVIPLSDLNLDYDNLEEIFQETIAEYERYKPLYKKEVMSLSQNPTYLPTAKRIVSVRPYVGGFYEHTTPLDFRDYDLYQKNLSTTVSGSFTVEYLASYRRLNYTASYEQTLVTPMERQLKFRLKGHYKKGTLNFSIFDPTLILEIKEDFASYQKLNISITNIAGNTITISSPDAILLSTGTEINIKSIGGVVPNPLNSTNSYFLIKLSNTTYQLANSIQESLQNIPIILTNTGSGTLTLETVVNSPYVNLIGNIGYGKLDLNTLKVELNLIGSYSGLLSCSFISLYSAIEELDINDVTFNRLFKGNLLMSTGLIKEILKLPDLPFDFSTDSLYNKGEEIKKQASEELIDTGKWWLFRA